LTELLMGSLSYKGGLIKMLLPQSCYALGLTVYPHFRIRGPGSQKKFAPFSTGVHCHAHKINLAVKTLSQLSIFHSIEEVMRVAYSYFSHSPKKFDEYKSWASTIDTKGLKLLKNVTTCWLSLLEPMRRLQSEYCTILGKMETDSSNKKENVSFGSLFFFFSYLFESLFFFFNIYIFM
jgi:hypothetical protein